LHGGQDQTVGVAAQIAPKQTLASQGRDSTSAGMTNVPELDKLTALGTR
jgi:hypothetical protein